MTLPVKRIKNMEPAAWQLFKDLARAHGLEHAAMLKWLTEEQVRREVAAPSVGLAYGGPPWPPRKPTRTDAAANGLASDADNGPAEPPRRGTV